MRTTLNLPDGLAEEAKRRATHDGRTLTSLIEEGLRLVLQDSSPTNRSILPTHGTADGTIKVDISDRDALWATLDGPDTT